MTFPKNALPAKNNLTFMVIDDDAAIVNAVGDIIRLTGNAAERYTDPVSAVHNFGEHPQKYDAIITDLRMPAMDGHEVVRNVRKVDKKIPVVVITANENCLSKEDVKKFSIHKLIPKPFSLTDIFAFVKSVSTMQVNRAYAR